MFTSEFNGCERDEIVNGVRIIRGGGKYTVYRRAKYFCKENCRRFDVIIDEINTRPFLTPKFVAKEKIIALIHQLAREFWFCETPFPVSIIGYYFLENYWLSHYRSVPTITVSESTKRDLEQIGFKRVFIVRNGLDVRPLDAIPKKSERPTVIFLGRMKRAKKPQDVVEAFKLVKKEVKDAQLWMVGDGYLRRKLEDKAKDAEFFGFVNGKTKVELLKKAWIIAVPGVREGWGQVVTQANALATPAVGYDIPGLRDSIKHGYNGLLVEGGDIQAFAETITKVLIDDVLRNKLSRNTLEWAKQFSWDKSAEEFERVIESVIE